MEQRRLGNTDLEVSLLGFGAAPLGDEYGSIDAAEGARAVHYAIDRGINFFDVAPYYGRTLAEERLGEALQAKRDQIILCTKCCRYGFDSFDFSAQRVETSIDESLKRLRTDHLDLYLIHDIEFGDRRRIIDETIPAARKVQQAGKTRYIGMSGLPLKILREVAAEAPVDVILSYARCNLMVNDLDTILRPFACERGIGLINASPLHMRILTEAGAPGWHPAPPEVKRTGRKVVALCRSHGVRASDVALRYCLDYPYVATTLVGMADQRQVEQNLSVLDFKTDPGLLKMIETLIAPVKNRTWPSGSPENQDSTEGASFE